jgi:hypothetical protein
VISFAFYLANAFNARLSLLRLYDSDDHHPLHGTRHLLRTVESPEGQAVWNRLDEILLGVK